MAEKEEPFSSIKQEISDELKKKVNQLSKTPQKSEKHEIERWIVIKNTTAHTVL